MSKIGAPPKKVNHKAEANLGPKPTQREAREAEQTVDVPAARAAELSDRSGRRRTAANHAAAAVASTREVKAHNTRAAAEAAASKACAHLAKATGVQIPGYSGFYPLVILRPDQAWMATNIMERGALVRQMAHPENS